MDFVHDQLATGRKLRVLTIVDTFSRFLPATEARFNFRGADVVDVLERVRHQIGIFAIAYYYVIRRTTSAEEFRKWLISIDSLQSPR